MTNKAIAIISIFLLFSCSSVNAGEAFFGTVIKVIDGDSLLIASGRRRIEVRLYGIDAPEYKQPFSEEAKKFVKQWVGRQQVQIRPEDLDPYGRTVAVIVKGERVLNYDLIQAGLAWVYPRYCKKKDCASWESVEERARSEKKGLWADSKPVSPWQWKRQGGGK